MPWLGGLLVLYLVLPLLALLGQLGSDTWSTLQTGATASALGVSAAAATVSTALIAAGGIPLGYLLARSQSAWTAAISILVHLPLALPPLASGILLVLVLGPYTWLGGLFHGSLTDSFAGVVAAQTFVAAPFLIVAARSAFAAIPESMEGVAATLGHGPAARWRRFLLPAAWPGIRAGLLLAWVRAFGEFGATAVVAYHPYSLPILTWVQFGSRGLPAAMPFVLVSCIAAAAFLVLGQTWPARRATVPSGAAGDRPFSVRSPGVDVPRAAEVLLSFDLHRALPGFRLDLAHAAGHPRLVLLGPSGAGKSLTLRMLAGIEPLDFGFIHAGREDWSHRPAEHRGIGYVPQDGALFPHLSVWGNLMAGAGCNTDLARKWLRRLGLEGLERRFPDELSGGQRQRVALGRALATSPALLLLDEPFSALDTPVREELRRDLRELQRDTGITTVVVSHDPADAAILGDEVLILADGSLLRCGLVRDVFERPGTAEVARLLGLPNVHSGRVAEPGVIESGGLRIPAPAAAGLRAGDTVHWRVDPDGVRFAPDGRFPAIVADVYPLRGAMEWEVRLIPAGLRLVARPRPGGRGPAGGDGGSDEPPAVGDDVRVDIDPDAIQVLG